MEKVKLPLYLTKYHAIRTYRVLNQAPHHEDVWGSEGIAPRINFGIRWRRVVSFTTQTLYPGVRAHSYH
jgi:hypothetical protein